MGRDGKMTENEDLKTRHDFHDLQRDFKWLMDNWVHGDKKNFHQMLFLALLKADEKNFVKIEREFPEHAHMIRSHKNPTYFLK